MSIFIEKKPSDAEWLKKLLDDLERCALAVAGRGTVQQRSDGLNSLTVAPDYATHVGLAKLQLEDGGLAGDFRQNHVVGKLNELANHELEKFFHIAFFCSNAQ